MNDKDLKFFSIKELFESDDYVIPIYQRNYEWREPQITQLIQDIVDYIPKNRILKDKPKYYIGTLIVYERKLDGKIIYETIDGQQRLTTLTILLNVIKNELKVALPWYEKLNLSFYSRKIASNTLSYLFFNKENIDNNECNVAIIQGYEDAKKSLEKILEENKLSIKEFCDYFFDEVRILRVLVPEDTDLNHYFEIMNSRGEQLEKHEILKAKMLEVLENDNLKYAFNLIWEATSNMEKYVQYGFSVNQRNEIFNANGSNEWNNLVDVETLYNSLTIKPENKQDRTYDNTLNQNNCITIDDLLKSGATDYFGHLFGDKKAQSNEDVPERFNTIINFSNFLLHILKIQVNQNDEKTNNKMLAILEYLPKKDITLERVKDISLDDKQLLEIFEPFYKNDKEFVKQFGYNLLKGKFYFDKYVIKREFKKGTDHWSLKRLKCYNGNNVSYVSTFDADNEESNKGLNRQILMLLSIFHVSSSTLVYKHWLNACLKYLFEYSGTEVGLADKYKIYIENLAKAFLNDRFLAKTPKTYYEIIYTNYSIQKNSLNDIDINKLNKGTAVENFIFNYLDYLLWQNYSTPDRKYFITTGKQQFNNDDRIRDFEYTIRSSVEHYFPQHPINVNLTLKGDDAKWLDNFGNLCLISISKNSRLNNSMPTEKKEYYKESLTIDSIKQRIMMEYDQWDTNGTNNVNEIEDHSKKMIELLIN